MNKYRLSFDELVAFGVYWLHGVLRPKHKTCLRLAGSYIVPWCEDCHEDAGKAGKA